jgi:hypothetical protein
MSEAQDTIRLSKLARELNVGIGTIIEEAEKKGIKIENNPKQPHYLQTIRNFGYILRK